MYFFKVMYRNRPITKNYLDRLMSSRIMWLSISYFANDYPKLSSLGNSLIPGKLRGDVVGLMPVGYPCREFGPGITGGGLFLFCFCVLATGSKAQTTPSREYIRLGTRVIAIEVPIPSVAAPTFSPAGANYRRAQTVTISTSTAGATIRYTLDGSTPTETNGTVGTSVKISNSETLKAIAYKSSMTDSPVTSANYTIGK
jgi:hypothetical protein